MLNNLMGLLINLEGKEVLISAKSKSFQSSPFLKSLEVYQKKDGKSILLKDGKTEEDFEIYIDAVTSVETIWDNDLMIRTTDGYISLEECV